MECKYGHIPDNQIIEEQKYFMSAIFKLLPYKQDGYEHLDSYFDSVIQRLFGFNKLSGYQPEIITIISLLEYAREENDFTKYRKAILDACGIIGSVKGRDTNA